MEPISSLRTIDDFLLHSTMPRDAPRNMHSRSSTMSDRRISIGASLADLIKVGVTRRKRTSSSPTLPFDFSHHADSIMQHSYASDEEVASPAEGDDLSSLASISGRNDADETDDDDDDDEPNLRSDHDIVHRVSDELARSCRIVDDECSNAKAVRIVRAGNPKVVVVARSPPRSTSISTALSDGRDAPQLRLVSGSLHQSTSKSSPRGSVDSSDPVRRPSLRVQTRPNPAAWAAGTVTKCEFEPRPASPSAPSLLRRKMPLSLKSLGRSVRRQGNKSADNAAKTASTSSTATTVAPSAASTSSQRPSAAAAPTPAKLIPRGACERAPTMMLPPSPSDDEADNDESPRDPARDEEMHPGFWLKRKTPSSAVALDSRSGRPMVYTPDRGRAPPAGLGDAPSVVYAHA